MRVAWVHPSWRDLVIEHLAGDAEHRRAFVGACELPGFELALSTEGGTAGERRLPLLVADDDWDALADTAHRLCRELPQPELARLLSALNAALRAAAPTDPAKPELRAIAELVLGATQRRFDLGHETWEVGTLERWLALARLLPRRLDPPDARPTWERIEPASVDAGDPASVAALEAWLALTAVLRDEIPGALVHTGFPRAQRRLLEDFLRQVEAGVDFLTPGSEQVLWHIAALDPDLETRAHALLRRGTPPQPEIGPLPFAPGRAPADRRRVRRILMDL